MGRDAITPPSPKRTQRHQRRFAYGHCICAAPFVSLEYIQILWTLKGLWTCNLWGSLKKRHCAGTCVIRRRHRRRHPLPTTTSLPPLPPNQPYPPRHDIRAQRCARAARTRTARLRRDTRTTDLRNTRTRIRYGMMPHLAKRSARQGGGEGEGREEALKREEEERRGRQSCLSGSEQPPLCPTILFWDLQKRQHHSAEPSSNKQHVATFGSARRSGIVEALARYAPPPAPLLRNINITPAVHATAHATLLLHTLPTFYNRRTLPGTTSSSLPGLLTPPPPPAPCLPVPATPINHQILRGWVLLAPCRVHA